MTIKQADECSASVYFYINNLLIKQINMTKSDYTLLKSLILKRRPELTVTLEPAIRKVKYENVFIYIYVTKI